VYLTHVRIERTCNGEAGDLIGALDGGDDGRPGPLIGDARHAASGDVALHLGGDGLQDIAYVDLRHPCRLQSHNWQLVSSSIRKIKGWGHIQRLVEQDVLQAKNGIEIPFYLPVAALHALLSRWAEPWQRDRLLGLCGSGSAQCDENDQGDRNAGVGIWGAQSTCLSGLGQPLALLDSAPDRDSSSEEDCESAHKDKSLKKRAWNAERNRSCIRLRITSAAPDISPHSK